MSEQFRDEGLVEVYLLVALSTVVWAVLFGAGLFLWWATSRPAGPHRSGAVHTGPAHAAHLRATHRSGHLLARPGGPRHRAHP